MRSVTTPAICPDPWATSDATVQGSASRGARNRDHLIVDLLRTRGAVQRRGGGYCSYNEQTTREHRSVTLWAHARQHSSALGVSWRRDRLRVRLFCSRNELIRA